MKRTPGWLLGRGYYTTTCTNSISRVDSVILPSVHHVIWAQIPIPCTLNGKEWDNLGRSHNAFPQTVGRLWNRPPVILCVSLPVLLTMQSKHAVLNVKWFRLLSKGTFRGMLHLRWRLSILCMPTSFNWFIFVVYLCIVLDMSLTLIWPGKKYISPFIMVFWASSDSYVLDSIMLFPVQACITLVRNLL